MRTRCPVCGTTLSLDALIAHDGARDALVTVFKLSDPLGRSILHYLSLFRPQQRDLSMDRVAKLLAELLPDIQAQRISRSRQIYDAPHEAWMWAIEQAVTARNEGRLILPLKGHGWLYEVISHWRPVAGDAVLAAPTEGRAMPSRSQSKTLSAISALEERARG